MSDNDHNGHRTSPLYSFQEAGRLAHVSSSTVRNWLYGYSTDYGDVPPLFPQHEEQDAMVSFLQLVEIVVAGRFRKADRIPFRTVRQAYMNLKKETGLAHPFARYDLEALGRHILMPLDRARSRASLQTADNLNQWTLPGLVTEAQEQFDYDLDLVSRWYPVGKTVPIVIDPEISTGLPTIVGRGVTVSGIVKRWKAGQRMDFIAGDLVLERDVVEKVVWYADQYVIV
jgi:uncharacterized protein (DUF433 family)